MKPLTEMGTGPSLSAMLTPRFLAQPKLCAFPLNMLFFHSLVHFLVNAHVHSFGNLTLFCILFVRTGTEQGLQSGASKNSDHDLPQLAAEGCQHITICLRVLDG